MAWVGQQDGEGSIVDMFLDDMRDRPKNKKNLKRKHIVNNRQERYCPRCGRMLPY